MFPTDTVRLIRLAICIFKPVVTVLNYRMLWNDAMWSRQWYVLTVFMDRRSFYLGMSAIPDDVKRWDLTLSSLANNSKTFVKALLLKHLSFFSTLAKCFCNLSPEDTCWDNSLRTFLWKERRCFMSKAKEMLSKRNTFLLHCSVGRGTTKRWGWNVSSIPFSTPVSLLL